MNYWRLLLLAVVAVFQPIASFADNNLIDGRQQCCDRLASAPLQDTRSSLLGTTRLGKTTSALRRLNDRDETREDRRYEVKQRVSIFSRPSTERPLVDVRARVARQAPSEIVRSFRIAPRQERPANSQSHERLLDVHQRKETVQFIRDLKPQDRTRRVVDRSRDGLERRNDRVYTESPRDRDDYRTERFGNERLSKNLFDSQRETQREQFRSVERRVTLNGDARRVLSRTQDSGVPSIEDNHINNRQRIARERLGVVRRESIIRPDTRRNSDRNDERRDLQRNNEQRLSLTGNTRLVDRIRDMHIRHTAREDNRNNRQRIQINRRISNERFDERREQTEERRESRQQNKENIDRSTSVERMQVDRRITRESRIMNAQNERNVDGRRDARMTREIRDETREKPDQRLSRERILMDRRNIRESRIMNARDKREFHAARQIIFNERMTRETRDEKTKNLDQRLSRERIQMVRRNTRESRTMNVQNTRNVADRRENWINERQTRDGNRENLEQKLSRERIQMDRKNIRESRMMKAQNIRHVADRRDLRNKQKMTRETREEIRENLEQRLSRERTQMDRKNTRESRTMNARNTRNVANRRENRINERLTREAQDENRENLDQRLSRETVQMDRRNTRELKLINGQNTRNFANRRDIRHKERMTRETRDENRENPEQRLSHDIAQMDRRDIRESKIMNAQNTRAVAVRREIRNSERISRNARDERENHVNRLSVERTQVDRSNFREFRVIQMERRNIRELGTVNTPSDKQIDSRPDIRYNERSAEISKEARVKPEQRISQERIQMDRRNVREFRNRNIVIRTDRDVESRREIRNDMRLYTENRENPDNRLSRERIQMHRRNIRESRIGNTLHIRDLDSRQEIRLARESRVELRENPNRRLARESMQVDGQKIRESRVNRVATRNERSVGTDTESRLEIRNNERLSGQIHGDQIIRERRVQSNSADRVNAEDRDSLMMDRRARSVERRNFREIRAEPRLNLYADSKRRSEVFRNRVEHTHRIENREREAIDVRSRNVEMAQNRERSSVMVGKMETENDFTVATWQYVLYTLQAAYLCALFMQMLTPSRTGKAHKMSIRWLPVSSHYNPIKVD